ncbi:MAG: hypothetical protein ABIJ57_00090 [Pseudomonadota bacterium]
MELSAWRKLVESMPFIARVRIPNGYFGATEDVDLRFYKNKAVFVWEDKSFWNAGYRDYSCAEEVAYYFNHHRRVHFPKIREELNHA